MKFPSSTNLPCAALVGALIFTTTLARAADPLPSWNDGKAKQSIVAFVEKVTKEGSADFVPVAERIATFDNDGTLWSEQPTYFQAFFVFDRIKQLAPQHPECFALPFTGGVLAGHLTGNDWNSALLIGSLKNARGPVDRADATLPPIAEHSPEA